MVASELDADLTELCSRLYCRYTRYADDITISSSRREFPPQLARYPSAQGSGQVINGDSLTTIIERHNFLINHRKSRLQSYWTRQTCTGIVVNSDHPSPPRRYARNVRSLLDHWRKNGWEEAAQILSEKENRPLFQERDRLANHVLGKIAYLKMVRGQDDPIAQRLEETFRLIPSHL